MGVYNFVIFVDRMVISRLFKTNGIVGKDHNYERQFTEYSYYTRLNVLIVYRPTFSSGRYIISAFKIKYNEKF